MYIAKKLIQFKETAITISVLYLYNNSVVRSLYVMAYPCDGHCVFLFRKSHQKQRTAGKQNNMLRTQDIILNWYADTLYNGWRLRNTLTRVGTSSVAVTGTGTGTELLIMTGKLIINILPIDCIISHARPHPKWRLLIGIIV